MEHNVQLQNLINDFLTVARISAVSISRTEIEGEVLLAPHKRPKSLPEGKKAVYAFLYNGQCLKVGKAGPKTKARFTSQHYSPRSSRSNLAKSILKSINVSMSCFPAVMHSDIEALSDETIGSWIQTNCTRYHIFLDSGVSDFVLSLLEAFLQCRLKPIFEG